MQRIMMKSKIHRATITGADLNYIGSITLDTRLMELADIREHEQVHVLDIDNGARFETYVIPGGPGDVILNGAAARLVHPGDKVIVITYAQYDEAELAKHEPRVVHVDEHNQPTMHSDPRGRAVTRRRPRRVVPLHDRTSPLPIPPCRRPGRPPRAGQRRRRALGRGARPPRGHVGHRGHQGRARVVGHPLRPGWCRRRARPGRRLARAARLRHARRRRGPLRHRRGARARERGPDAGPGAGRARRPLRRGRRRATSFARTREGGHSVARVVHAGGDATGAEIERALVAAVQARAPRSASGGWPPTCVLEHGPGRRRHRASVPTVRRTRARPQRARRHRRRRPVLRRHHQPRALHRRRHRHGACAPAPRSPTSSSCSSTRPRCTTRRCRARSSPRRCGARARSCATSRASRSCATSTRSPTSRRATSSPRRSAVAASTATSTTSGSTPPTIDRLPGAVPHDLVGVPRGRARPDPRLAAGRAGRALPLGWCVHRPRRRDDAARALGVRRGGVHRRARRQPAGVELAARRAGVRGARGRGDRRRAHRPRAHRCAARRRAVRRRSTPVTVRTGAGPVDPRGAAARS